MSSLPPQERAARCPELREESRRLTILIVLSSAWIPFVDLITIFDFCLPTFFRLVPLSLSLPR